MQKLAICIIFTTIPLLTSSQNIIHQFESKNQFSNPRHFKTVGDKVFFTADDGIHGRELWVTDGTEGGTHLLKDMVDLCYNVIDYVHMVDFKGNLIYFIRVNSGVDEYWLCQSDGTSAGTRLIERFNNIDTYYTAFATGNAVCFFVDNSLWATDGNKVQKIKDLRPDDPNKSISANGVKYFIATADSAKIWKTDGTANGTKPISKALPYNKSALGILGKHIHYVADRTMFRLDTSNFNTEIVPFLNTQSAPTNILLTVNNLLFFSTTDSNGSPNQLWVSDGTEGGTKPFFENKSVTRRTLYLNNYFNFKNKFYGFVYESLPYKYYLLESDGTVEGTKLGDYVFNSNPHSIVSTDSLLFFTVNDTLFVTNGAQNGLKNLGTEKLFYPNNVTIYHKKIIGGNIEPSISDGTLEGTKLLVDLNIQNSTAASSYYMYTPLNNELYYIATDNNAKTSSILKSNASLSNTSLLFNINDFSDYYYYPSSTLSDTLFKYKNQFIFPYFKYAKTGIIANEALMISDGTLQGTKLLVDSMPNIESRFRNFVHYKDKFVFRNFDSFRTKEALWISDGTPQGTKKIFSLPPPYFFRLSSSLVAFKGELYFIGGSRLWKTDGTESGTMVVPQGQDTLIGFTIVEPRFEPIVVNNRLIIKNGDGSKIWSFDGEKFELLQSATASNYLSVQWYNYAGSKYFYPIGNKMYYCQYNSSGYRLVESDGTFKGTKVISSDFKSSLDGFQYFKNELYYLTRDSNRVAGLWKTNLNTYETSLVKPFDECNKNYYFPSTIINGDKIYFQGIDSEHGGELWESDGTTAGTKLLLDINKGLASSNPQSFYNFNGNLIFTADNGTGNKLFKLSISTGILEEIEARISAYPNPIKDILTIKSDDNNAIKTVEISNIWGQVIKILQPDTPSVSLDFGGFKSGIYYIFLKTNTQKTIKKIVKIE